MKRMFEFGRESVQARARNFSRQAEFMQDYEDDFPWTGQFFGYFPTYQDMTTKQLRGYFTWRTQLRLGNIQPIPISAAYIYVFELLNGVGADSPEDAFRKMQDFEEKFLDSGIGDDRIRPNLKRWMMEFGVLKNLPPDLVSRVADPEQVERDTAISVLRTPGIHSADEVFDALISLGGRKIEASPVLKMDAARGKQLFADAWRVASACYSQEKDLCTQLFGEKRTRAWYPLTNAVYYEKEKPVDREYRLNDCRLYYRKGGRWFMEAFEKLSFDRGMLQGFLHEADARFRRYLKTGRYLKENSDDEWAIPYIDAVIEADRKAVIEASRPKISIDFSGLDRIRQDALVTQESLLTEEELGEEHRDFQKTDVWKEEDVFERTDTTDTETLPLEMNPDIPLDPVQFRILHRLLSGEDVSELLKEGHLMPSVTADAINEALFDEFGDTVLLCEDDRLLLVDDYIEDLKKYLGDCQ